MLAIDVATLEEIIEKLRVNCPTDTDSLISTLGMPDFERGVHAGVLTSITTLENLILRAQQSDGGYDE